MSEFFQKADRYRDGQPQMVPNDSQATEFQQNHFLYGQKKDEHAYQKV